MSAQVTALGIRDGDPAVLETLVDRRGFAVLAYCERACPPGMGVEAAADAFARFRATVMSTDRPGALDPEAALLSATRHAAVDRVPRPVAPNAGPLGRLLGGKAPTDLLAAVPELLVARADGVLQPADEERLVRLLDASAAARAVEERFRAAEHAYRTAAPRPVSAGVRERIVASMGAAPGVAAVNGNSAAAYDDAPPPDDAAAPDADPVQATEPDAGEADVPAEAGEAAPDVAAEAQDLGATAGAVSIAAAGDSPPSANSGEVTVPPHHEPALTEEWALPPEALAGDDSLDTEIAAARLHAPEEDAAAEEAEHVQSASGAVEEPLVEPGPADRVAEVAAQLHRSAKPAAPGKRPAAAAAAQIPMALGGATPAPEDGEPPHTRGVARTPRERHAFPGTAALAPAGAVVTIAAIGALVASGVFGGNDPSPPLDTGIVPPRALQAVPDGEAAAVIDDLQSAASDARRRRLADRRQALAAAQLQPEPAPEATTDRTNQDADTSTRDDDPTPTREAQRDEPAAAPPADGNQAAPDTGAGGTGGTTEEPTVQGEVGGTGTP